MPNQKLPVTNYILYRDLTSRSGIGYTYRVFYRDKHEPVILFADGNLSYIALHARNNSFSLSKPSGDSVMISARKLFGISIGFGLGLNFLHRFTLNNSFGAGYALVRGYDERLAPGNVSVLAKTMHYNLFYQVRISLLYHCIKF
jgi:hypothetical protein